MTNQSCGSIAGSAAEEAPWTKELAKPSGATTAFGSGHSRLGRPIFHHARSPTKSGRVRITRKVQSQLLTFLDLLEEGQRPTHIEELIPGNPVYKGACDAAKAGMGGVWFADHNDTPLLWRAPFPQEVQNSLASVRNPTGLITNSDLELAGTIAHQAVLGETHDVHGETTHTHCDNTPAVFWREKGSSTTTRCRSDLLRLAALLRKQHCANHKISHISGDANDIADDASRLQHMSEDALLTYFNSTYPQTKPWQICPLNSQLNSLISSILLTGGSSTQSLMDALGQLKQPGTFGTTSVANDVSTRAYPHTKTNCLSSSCLENYSTSAPMHPRGSRSALAMRRTTYATWARNFPQWVRQTPV